MENAGSIHSLAHDPIFALLGLGAYDFEARFRVRLGFREGSFAILCVTAIRIRGLLLLRHAS